MERVGMILDVTHLSDQSFDDAMDVYSGPVLASHHNCRALVPNQRQLSDEQINKKLEQMEAARKARKFSESDAIRAELNAAGIIVEQGKGGARWKRK